MDEFFKRIANLDFRKKFPAVPLPVFLFASAFIAFLVVNYFFCPRYYLWKGLDLPGAWTYPEVNRAVFALEQIKHPFEPIHNASNDAIRWRLLFPLLAHYLAIPNSFYLAIPHVGCLLTLAWIGWIGYRETHSRKFSFIVSVLFGTSSWLFVSAGWLTYFDSWYILGLLLYSFHPSRVCLTATCLLIPWIDERFILALPMALVVRTIYFDRQFAYRCKPFLYDLLVTGLTITPFVLFRIYLIQTAKDLSPSATVWQTPIGQPGIYWIIFGGWWSGLRLLWAYPLVFGLLSIYRSKQLELALMFLATLLALVLNLRFAADISRSASNVIPLAVLGFVQSVRCAGFPWKHLLCWLCGLNLALPAYHVITIGTTPIFDFPYQRLMEHETPVEFTSDYHNKKGIEAWMQKDASSAIRLFSGATHIDPGFAKGYLNRGLVYFAIGKLVESESDIRRAIQLSPVLYEGRYQLAKLLLQKNDRTEAIALLQSLVDEAPPDFEHRAEAEKLLRQLKGP